MFVDTHAHLNFKAFENDYKNVVQRAFDNNVKSIICVGSNYKTSQKAVEIAEEYSSTRMKSGGEVLDSSRPPQWGDSNSNSVIASEAWQSRDPSTSSQWDFAQDDTKLYAVIGCHPIHLSGDITESENIDGKEYKFTTRKEEFDLDKYQKLIDSSDKVVGIGETGLDYFRLGENNKLQNPNDKLQINLKSQITNEKKIQKQIFQKHIKLARENNLPLVLHCRGAKDNPYYAYDEMIKILKYYANTRMSRCSKISGMRDKYANDANENNKQHKYSSTRIKSGGEVLDSSRLHSNNKLRAVIHCFAGNLKQAQEFIKLGFYVGVNGIVTFKNSRELQSIIKKIPLNKILLETDCPYLTPRPPSQAWASCSDVAGVVRPQRKTNSRGVAGVADPHRGKRNEPSYIPIIAQKIAEIKNVDIKKVESQTTKNVKKLFDL